MIPGQHGTVEVSYGAGWDPRAAATVAPLSTAEAAALDAAGEPYAVILKRPGRPHPEAVLHVAWSHHYLGIWRYDEHGRRWREHDLRRLDPEWLFLIHEQTWTYALPQTAEFAPEAGRTTLELSPGKENARWTEEKRGDRGSSSSTLTAVPSERRRLPVPAFGDWTMALEGPCVLTDAAPAAPAPDTRRPWDPPAGLRPRHLDAMFTPGTVFTPQYDEAAPRTVEPSRTLGTLHLPSGRIVACDPCAYELPQPLTVSVPPGDYVMDVASVSHPSGYEDMTFTMEETTAVRLLISQRPTVGWEMALTAGQDPRLLRERHFYGFDVDTATGCFTDAALARDSCRRFDRSFTETDPLVEHSQNGALIATVRAQDGSAVLIAFALSGDGSYPVWIGRDAAGEVTCFVVDALELTRAELMTPAQGT